MCLIFIISCQLENTKPNSATNKFMEFVAVPAQDSNTLKLPKPPLPCDYSLKVLTRPLVYIVFLFLLELVEGKCLSSSTATSHGAPFCRSYCLVRNFVHTWVLITADHEVLKYFDVFGSQRGVSSSHKSPYI